MAIDWSELQKKYGGLWVALKKDERTVLAAEKTAKQALEKAKATGYEEPILTRMPDSLVAYVG